jgi:GTP-binding protein
LNVSAEFVTSATGPGDFPKDWLPEIALVGRSNVGKSSLLNALVRRPVARTSAAPGKTRLVNFYRVKINLQKAFYLVDLPGYGYVRGAKNAGAFGDLVEAYFTRTTVKGVLLLIDARHPGLEVDQIAWNWINEKTVQKIIIATKADKLTRAMRVRHTKELESLYKCPLRLVSIQSGEGLEGLWKLIVKLKNLEEIKTRELSLAKLLCLPQQ